MRIATKERYALKMMADLASAGPDESVSLTSISIRQGISVDSLKAIAPALLEAGLVETDANGLNHYRLAQPSGEIRLQDIFCSTNGRFACLCCTQADPADCKRYRICSRVHFWEGLQEIDLPFHEKNVNLKTVAEYLAAHRKTSP